MTRFEYDASQPRKVSSSLRTSTTTNGQEVTIMKYVLPGTGAYSLDEPFQKLIPADVVAAQIPQMAGALNGTLRGRNDRIVGVTLERGGGWTAGAVRPYLDFAFEPVSLRTKKYPEDGTHTGDSVGIIGEGPEDQGVNVNGAIVVLFEDIVDEGDTMDWVLRYFYDLGATQVIIVTLLDKPSRRKAGFDFEIDICGFEIVDVWVFGCGMDDGNGNQVVRTLNAVYFYLKDGVSFEGPGYKLRL